MKKYSKQQLKQELQRISEEELDGGIVRGPEFDEHSEINPATPRRKFGSWNDYLQESNVGTKEKIAEEINRISQEHCGGDSPTVREFNEYSPFPKDWHRKRIGSWNEALEYASLEANQTKEAINLSDQDLLEHIEELANKLDRVPTSDDVDEIGKVTCQTYQNRFGSWNKAVKEAGFENNSPRNIPKEKVLKGVKAVVKEIDEEHLTYRDIQNNCKYSISTIKRIWADWDNFLENFDLKRKGSYGQNNPNWRGGYENYYGPSWPRQRTICVERDSFACRVCGNGENIIVHHIEPQRKWDVEEEHEEMNDLSNLVTLCRSCHPKLERKWQDASPKEFVENAKDELDIDFSDEEKRSIFDF